MQIPSLTIPVRVRDHNSFRQWARSRDCPEKTRLAYYRGALWVDLSLEELYSHNQVKAEVCAKLHSHARIEQQGTYAIQGALLSVPSIGLTCMPDGLYFTFDAIDTGRIKEIGDRPGECVELEGSPDMVLEVVNDASETRDLIDLRELYFRAGIQEYWLIDARGDACSFQILKLDEKEYVSAEMLPDGWQQSDVFASLFRLVRTQDRCGQPDFTLEAIWKG